MTPLRKSYFAPSIDAAMTLALKELGDDALILETRRTSPGGSQRAGYEVVAEAPSPRLETVAAAGVPGPALDSLVADVASLKNQMIQLSAILDRRSAAAAPAPYPELSPLAARLSAADFPTPLVDDILMALAHRLRLSPHNRAASEHAINAAFLAELEVRVKCRATLGVPAASRRIVALIGPPGSGKTTTLVKLAMRSALTERRPALIVSADHYRIAAAEQLRSCAAILGLPFEQAETPAALVRVLAEHRGKELVFVDTPGLCPQEAAIADDWAALFRETPELDVHLVLQATTRTADILRRMEWWENFNPSRLIFTHVDETSCPGGVVAVAAVTGKPVSFLGLGQSVPEDLEEASLTRLTAFLPMDVPGAKAAAA